MKQKILMLLAMALLTSVCAMAQSNDATPLKGDVNGDKNVTIADVTVLVNIILGKAEPNAVADVNGDGSVDVADISAVIDIMAGK